ncbi:unnamed protein product [Heterobilharzia americana]|nr:unnamed protein product [Heterobilharzia americana]
MPTDLRQSRSYVSYHATFSEAPHPVGRHHILQTHGQQNASDRLYQIAMQATVANAEAFKGACDDGHKLILEDSRPSLNKMKSNKASHKHKTNSNTSTSNNVTSRTKTVHLTPQQWQLLTDYHEHDLFVRTRSWSFCMAVLGVGVTLFGIGSPAWKWIGDARHPYELGLWNLCLPNNSTCLFIIYHLQNNWKLHTSIICLLGCACLFGLLGLGLAITGVCKSALILRLYYYHSAGECFLVSSITTITSLILYPFSAEACIQSLLKLNLFKFKSSSQTTMTSSHTFANNNRNPDDTDKISLESVESQYGYTYFLTWIAAAFFFSSFICMNLDLLIQSFVRPIPTISNVLTYLAPCWGSSVASLTRSPVLSSSSGHHPPTMSLLLPNKNNV